MNINNKWELLWLIIISILISLFYYYIDTGGYSYDYKDYDQQEDTVCSGCWY